MCKLKNKGPRLTKKIWDKLIEKFFSSKYAVLNINVLSTSATVGRMTTLKIMSKFITVLETEKSQTKMLRLGVPIFLNSATYPFGWQQGQSISFKSFF